MSKLWAERLTAVGMIVFAGFFIQQSQGLPHTSGAFPQFTFYVMIVLALIMFVRSFVTKSARLEGSVSFDFSYSALKPVYAMVVAVAYGFAIFEIGFYVSSIVFYFLVVYMTGFRNFKVVTSVAVVLFALMYLFFTIGLDADLPHGILI